MDTTPTMHTTIQNALIASSDETREITMNVMADDSLTYGEKYQLLDDILAHAEEAANAN